MYYKILDDNIGYIYYGSFSSGIGEGNLDEVMYYLRLCNGLIVDVRNNSGGTLTYAERLAERFTNEKRLVGYIAHKTTNTFVRDMKECPLVTIMGDRTGGGSGLPFSSELPNGWSVRFSACPMYDAGMNQIEFGIKPDTCVSLTQEDLARNKDTMIEAAREFLKR